MENYYFIYKRYHGWSACTNPVFIAEHRHCRAIPKHIVNDVLKYHLINDLVYDINNDKITEETIRTLGTYNINI